MKRVRVFVKGKVQGVSFRAHTRRKAQELGVTGWVKNLPDGSVGIIAEGEDDAVSQLVQWCRDGSPSADVDSIEVETEEYEGKFDDFQVKY